MEGKTALKWLGGLGLGLAVTALIKKGGNLATASQLIFDIVKVDIKGLDKLYLSLKISNPNPGTTTFNSINTELYFNNINVGRLYYNKPIMIAGRSEQTFVFPVIMYPSGVITVAQNILETKAKSGVFKIDGSAYINDIKVPVVKEIKSW